MNTSLLDENARLRVLLQVQQTTIFKMAEYNRLKALVAELQRIQFGKSFEKLREKNARQVREAEERIGALQEEMAEVPGEQHDLVLPQPLRQSSARKPLPASLTRETRTLPPTEMRIFMNGDHPITAFFKVVVAFCNKITLCRFFFGVQVYLIYRTPVANFFTPAFRILLAG